MTGAKTVQWKACARGHVYLGSRGCPACERANALRPRPQHPRRLRRQATERYQPSEVSHELGWPSERTAIARTLVTLRPPA
jgi:hypothetical protein